MYSLLRDLLFKLEAEQAHYFSMNLLRTACGIGPLRKIISSLFTPNNASLERQVFGLTFRNPVGLGAGFDKNAVYLRELEALGFGFCRNRNRNATASSRQRQTKIISTSSR
jgi:dihydroorotate dehydrogenase